MSEIVKEFSDVVPVPQDDGPNPVCAIAYREEFRQAMDIFRAVLRSSEKSARVLRLTEQLLNMNAANYTVWQYRRDVLASLDVPIQEELDFMDRFAEMNPKNYQIWFHRRAITERSGDASRELVFVDRVFGHDAKNYHAWAHRQWVVKTFGMWEGELAATERLLEVDVRNNSAWNHRWFVLHERPGGLTSLDDVEAEVAFACTALRLAPHNESPWNFVKGLCRSYPMARSAIKCKCVDEFLKSDPDNDSGVGNPNIFALDVHAYICEQTALGAGPEDGSEDRKALLQDAMTSYQILADADAIRSKYWRKRELATATLMDAE